MDTGTTPILFDVDTGIDDALAILYALRSPEARVVACGTVRGNVSSDQAAVNTLRVLEVAGHPSIPVAVGCDHPLIEPQSSAGWVHGDDGLGNTEQPAPRGKPTGEHAVDQMLRLTREHPGEITIVAVGPLTNLATALAKDPSFAERVGRVVIMGGTVAAPGNIGPATEANIRHDPEAAKSVFAAGWPLTMVGLDVTMQTFLTAAMADELRRSDDEVARFAAEISDFYLGAYERFLGERKCALHDPLAVAAALNLPILTTEKMYVEVETEGNYTRGMTVGDRRILINPEMTVAEPNVDVALHVDAPKFERNLMDRLMGRASTSA